ncbi:DUF1289 domain-containing protein [Arsukibacterium sp.]|uniref:DUF1289 domain-containing protein n=1 Tax=Arsukibacterium sp. TaxID=1977258 RepID=UPI002FDA7C4F
MVESPCVRNCCLDQADYCLGCGRSYQDILAWHQADNQARQQILLRAQAHLAERARLAQQQKMASGVACQALFDNSD